MSDTGPITPDPPPATGPEDYGAPGEAAPDLAPGGWRGNGAEAPAVVGNGADRALPPVNYEVEQALLGAILENNDAWDRVADTLLPVHFSDAVHGRIYEACGQLIQRGEQANALTLQSYFKADESLVQVGGADYLAKLQSSTITVVNAADYGRHITELWLRRNALEMGEDLADQAARPDYMEPASRVIETHIDRLSSLLEVGANGEGALAQVGDLMDPTLAEIELAYKGDKRSRGLATGLAALDGKIGALMPGKMVVLAGRPAMGKTALAENIAWRAAENGRRAAFFSLEMGREDLIKRAISRRTGIPITRMDRGELSGEEMDQVVRSGRELRDLPILIDDSARSVAAVRARARRALRRGGLDLVVVDYLQLMEDASARDRTDEVTRISRGIKMHVAKDLGVPVLLVSQLSRANEQRDDKRPMLSDLRQSGAIEQDADAVLFVFREEYYLAREEPMQKANETADKFDDRVRTWERALERARGKAEIIVAKQRSGPTGTAHLLFDGPSMRFRDVWTNA